MLFHKHRFMADLAIGFLQNVAASVLQKYRSFKHKPHSVVLLDKLPPPVLLKNAELGTGKCVLEQSLQGIKTGGEVRPSSASFDKQSLAALATPPHS